MDRQKGIYRPVRLQPGELYWDHMHKEVVEFVYMGQTGLAIVCEPGDSGGGMQSTWGVDPANLEGRVLKQIDVMLRRA